MGKKKKSTEKLKQWRKVALAHRGEPIQLEPPKVCKTKCCKKYKKSESKRCRRCPCFDLMKKVA